MPQITIPENTLTPQERNKLVEDNLKLVHYYVRRICKDSSYYDDCFQEGCIGLMRAAKLYDPKRNASFSTFASFEIQCAIRDYLWNFQLIKLPDEQRKAVNSYKTKIRELELDAVTITPDIADEVARGCKLNKNVHNLVESSITSLQSAVSGTDDDSIELGFTIKDDNAIDGQSNLELYDLINFITNYFDNLEIDDNETKTIIIQELNSLIADSLGILKAKSFLDIIRERHPELVTTNFEKSTDAGKEKSRKLDNIYCRTNYVWNKHKKELAKAIKQYYFATV